MAYLPVIFGAALMAICITWLMIDNMRGHRRLNALRRSCFITNEKGHRVRYVNASPEARAKAEQ